MIDAKVSRTDRKKEETRNKILEAARVLFREQGFDATTIEQIAEQADVAKGTIYNHFPEKEAIADACARERSREQALETLVNFDNYSDTKDRLISAISNSYLSVEASPDFASIVINYRLKNVAAKQPPEKTPSQELILKTISFGQEHGEIRTDLKAERILQYIDFLRTVTMLEWLNGDRQADLKQSVPLVVDLILNGIRSRN